MNVEILSPDSVANQTIILGYGWIGTFSKYFFIYHRSSFQRNFCFTGTNLLQLLTNVWISAVAYKNLVDTFAQ